MIYAEDINEWLQAKGVSVWPSVSADLSDPKERWMLAEWLEGQLDSLLDFVNERYEYDSEIAFGFDVEM